MRQAKKISIGRIFIGRILIGLVIFTNLKWLDCKSEMATRVLLVEDDNLARRNTALYLRRSQFEVDEAASGEEALHLITTIDQYDVIVSDLRMPGMSNGLDVISRQLRVSPATGCILVTAFGSQQLQEQAQALGAEYLEKPLSLADLRARIRSLISRHKT